MLSEFASLSPASRRFEQKVPELKETLGITRTHTAKAIQGILAAACSKYDVELDRGQFQALLSALSQK